MQNSLSKQKNHFLLYRFSGGWTGLTHLNYDGFTTIVKGMNECAERIAYTPESKQKTNLAKILTISGAKNLPSE